MNNEPVAWIAIGDNTSVFFDLDCALSIDDSPTPLYTHPAKTLTDEELHQLKGTLKWAEDLLREAGHIEAMSDVQDSLMIVKMALRKAQEK